MLANILIGNAGGKRPQRRLRRKWQNIIRKDLIQIVLDDVDGMYLA
jgi:hypothetical protein